MTQVDRAEPRRVGPTTQLQLAVDIDDRERVGGDHLGEPSGNGVVVDALTKDRSCLPRLEATGRNELDRRQLGKPRIRNPVCRRVGRAGGTTRHRQIAERGIGRSTGEHGVAPVRASQQEHQRCRGDTERDHQQSQWLEPGRQRIRRLRQWRHRHRSEPGEPGAHRDAVAGSERLDDGDVVAGLVDRELASTERAVGAGVAAGLEALEPGQHHVESSGLERLVVADHVEKELAVRHSGFGQCVLQDVAMTTGERHRRIPDPDPRLVAAVDHVHLGIGVGRCGRHIGRHPEVVAQDALVAAAFSGAEVDVDHLADPQSVGAVGRDGDLLGIEALGADRRVGTGADHAESGEQRHRHDHEADDRVTPDGDPGEHRLSLTHSPAVTVPVGDVRHPL